MEPGSPWTAAHGAWANRHGGQPGGALARATLFVRWEHVGAASLPVFEQFLKSELVVESEVAL